MDWYLTEVQPETDLFLHVFDRLEQYEIQTRSFQIHGSDGTALF